MANANELLDVLKGKAEVSEASLDDFRKLEKELIAPAEKKLIAVISAEFKISGGTVNKVKDAFRDLNKALGLVKRELDKK